MVCLEETAVVVERGAGADWKTLARPVGIEQCELVLTQDVVRSRYVHLDQFLLLYYSVTHRTPIGINDMLRLKLEKTAKAHLALQE